MCKVPIKNIHCRMAMYVLMLDAMFISFTVMFSPKVGVFAKDYSEISLIFITCLMVPVLC